MGRDCLHEELRYLQGCLLGGAVGDALGWPVKSLSWETIQERFGQQGITDLVRNQQGAAEITDDTQMTMFTLEGCLRASMRFRNRGIGGSGIIFVMMKLAYYRWLYTQGRRFQGGLRKKTGFLIHAQAMYARRDPDETCLRVINNLRSRQGEQDKGELYNDSQSCGALMRVAPVGILYRRERVFEIACECAQITHGHPGGYLPAGVLAQIIAAIMEDVSLEEAVAESVAKLKEHDGHEECLQAIETAINLARTETHPADAIRLIGEGLIAPEVIAIAIYSVLKYPNDFRRAVITAVNHSGISDTAGAITGNILGFYLGLQSIPRDWAASVELSSVLMMLASDLRAEIDGDMTEFSEFSSRYPGCLY